MQFDQPIGSFQVIKHRCARLLLTAELAAAAAWDAVRSTIQDADQQRLGAGTAAEVALGRVVDAVTEAITVFGGIGFTWEHDAHLYLRRATALAALASPADDRLRAHGRAALAAQRRIEVELPEEDPELRAEVGRVLDEAAGLTGDAGPVPAGRTPRRDLLVDHRLVSPHWPQPWGRGANATEQVVIAQEYARRGLTPLSTIIGEWAMPTIFAHGTPEQQQRFAEPTLRGELVWCQLFSEPGAGSDLAGLSTRAVQVDGGWRLSGQKVWTSGAHEADWGICLARTDPTVAKHKGLTYFLVDMRADGVDVRPLRQSTGQAEFCEVFLDDVFVPDDMLVGAPNEGWRLTATTLANERTRIVSGVGTDTLDPLRRLVRDEAYAGSREDALRRFGCLAATDEAVAALTLRETLRALNGLSPGAGSSLAKVATALLARDSATTAIDLAGAAAVARPPAPPGGDQGPRRTASHDMVHHLLALPAHLFGGGTVEIQLTIIAERILGLRFRP